MSDIESVESESMEIIRSGDSSDFYQPNYDTDVDRSKHYKPSKSSQPSQSNQSKQSTMKSTVPPTKTGSTAQKIPSKPMESSKTIGKHSIDEQSYSQAFEDENYSENDFETYSNDFEPESQSYSSSISKSKSKITSKIPTIQKPSNLSKTIERINPITSVLLSRTDPKPYEALQAELAIEEISKEVLRLRAAQKQELQKRRQSAFEKKQRAETRRYYHQEELRKLQSELSSAEELVREQSNEIDKLRHQNQSLELSLDTMKISKEEAEKQIIMLKEDIQNIAASKEQLLTELSIEREQLSNKRIMIEKEKQELQNEVFKYQTLTDIVHKSMEINEKRLKKDREDIPNYHKRLIDEQYERLKEYESNLSQREISIRLEEERRYASIETMKKNTMMEAAAFRKHIEEDILREKEGFESLKQSFLSEKQEILLSIEQKQNHLELQSLDIQQQQTLLSQQKIELDSMRLELQQQKNMIEPYLQSATHQRDETILLKRQAEELIATNEMRLSSIIKKEQEIVVLEHHYREDQHRISLELIRIQDERKLLIAKSIQLRGIEHELKTERFRVHQQAMEIADLSFHLQQYIRQTKLQTLNFSRINEINNNSDDKNVLIRQSNSNSNQKSMGTVLVNKENRMESPSLILRELDTIHNISSTITQEVDKSVSVLHPVDLNPNHSIDSSYWNLSTSTTYSMDPFEKNNMNKDKDKDKDNNTNMNSMNNIDTNTSMSPKNMIVIPNEVHADIIRSSIDSVNSNAKQLMNLAAKYTAA